MTAEALFESFADISEKYLKEAQEYRASPKKRRIWVVAACLAVVLAAIPLVRLAVDSMRGNTLVINQTDRIYGVDYSFMHKSYNKENFEEGLSRFEKNLGISYDEFISRFEPGAVSEGFTEYSAEYADTDHSYLLLVKTSDGGVAQISVTRSGFHFICPMFKPDDSEEESYIDGETVRVYEYEDILGGTEYIALFSHEGLHYDVRASVSTQAFEDLLCDIID
ncbi:MAG: hypothetical protein IJ457_07405 [Clostridia bacterium]|nr:hypothetical protein [Clostridia bacterium]